MKIKTTYTPSDTSGQDVNFQTFYTLADLAKLGRDLAAAGVTTDDALAFSVDSTGALTVIHDKTV